eukprot:g3393.t1
MAAAGCKAVLAVVAMSVRYLDVAHGFSSGEACPFDVASCLANDECRFCVDILQVTGLTIGDIEFELCGEIYAGVCMAAESVGCNADNEEVGELLACVFQDEADCDDFTTCADATAGPATGAPAATPSAAPATPSPSTAAATAVPVAPTPPTSFPSTAVPTSFPIAATPASPSPPTAAASPVPVAAAPAATTTPATAKPAAPTLDSRGDTFSPTANATPTTAPSELEALDDLEDGTNGEVSAIVGRTAGTAAWSMVLATALASFTSALAALGA